MDFVSVNLPEKINRGNLLLEPGPSYTPNAHQGGEKKKSQKIMFQSLTAKVLEHIEKT